MPLTIDELQELSNAAYLCDGELRDYFDERIAPHLNELPEGHLWALAGMFLGNLAGDEQAREIAAYAAHVRHLCVTPGKERQDAMMFIRELRFGQEMERDYMGVGDDYRF